MSDETPQWAASLPEAAVTVDDDQRLLTVDASRCGTNLQFGEVDPGWTIAITSAGAGRKGLRPQDRGRRFPRGRSVVDRAVIGR